VKAPVLPILMVLIIGNTRPTAGQTRPDNLTCTRSDSIYSAADTTRGVVVPKPKVTYLIRLKNVGTGRTEAMVIIEPNGKVRVESYKQVGDHGMRERGEMSFQLARWRFLPAMLNGCPVRFRTSVAVRSEGS
jgi:hypothetical protein